MVEPAVKGTINVLKAGHEAKVERVVFVSSEVAVTMNPAFPKDKVLDESCWSDKEYCRQSKVHKCKICIHMSLWFGFLISHSL